MKKKKVTEVKSIRILGHCYQIVLVPDHLGTKDMGGCFGCLDKFNMAIRICEDASPALQASTVLHEAIHAIDTLEDLQLKESQIASLAQGLYQVLRDNPNFVTAIQEWEQWKR